MDGVFLWLAAGLLWVIPLWVICGKVGLPPILSLAFYIPFIGFLIILSVLAYAKWPKVHVGTKPKVQGAI